MYPTITPGYGLARYVIGTSDEAHRANIVIGFENSAGLTADLAAQAVSGAYTGSNCPYTLLASIATLVEVQTVINVGGTLSEGSYTANVNGTAGVDIAGIQVCVLIQKLTGLVGRHFKGRAYLPFPATAIVDAGGGYLANPAQGQVVANAWYSALVSNGVPPVLLHRDLLVSPTLINGFNCESQLATQRRRLRKVAHR